MNNLTKTAKKLPISVVVLRDGDGKGKTEIFEDRQEAFAVFMEYVFSEAKQPSKTPEFWCKKGDGVEKLWIRWDKRAFVTNNLTASEASQILGIPEGVVQSFAKL